METFYAEDWYSLKSKWKNAKILEVDGGYTLDILLPLIADGKNYSIPCIMNSREECENLIKIGIQGLDLNF